VPKLLLISKMELETPNRLKSMMSTTEPQANSNSHSDHRTDTV
jgi:hypothetical protein